MTSGEAIVGDVILVSKCSRYVSAAGIRYKLFDVLVSAPVSRMEWL